MNTNSYTWLAQYYDELFQPFRLSVDAAHRHILAPILPKVTTACDLACGTGTTAIAIARHGIKVFAVDLSPKMCRITRTKSQRASVPVHVLRADMRDFKLPTPVDLIICEGDALNHLPRKSDLVKVARAAARALKPAGYFFFDVNMRKGFRQYWSRTQWMERPGLAVVMRGGEDHLHDKAWCDIDWFIRERTLWRRHHERIEEVCWSPTEIRRALTAAGFDRVRTWDAAPFFPDNPLVLRGCRALFLARKAPTQKV